MPTDYSVCLFHTLRLSTIDRILCASETTATIAFAITITSANLLHLFFLNNPSFDMLINSGTPTMNETVTTIRSSI